MLQVSSLYILCISWDANVSHLHVGLDMKYMNHENLLQEFLVPLQKILGLFVQTLSQQTSPVSSITTNSPLYWTQILIDVQFCHINTVSLVNAQHLICHWTWPCLTTFLFDFTKNFISYSTNARPIQLYQQISLQVIITNNSFDASPLPGPSIEHRSTR